jgi:hypothetical protein
MLASGVARLERPLMGIPSGFAELGGFSGADFAEEIHG